MNFSKLPDQNNTILNDENVRAVFNILNKNNKTDRDYKISKQVFCRYSGLPIQVSNYLQGKHNIHCQAHWIFNQNDLTVLSYMKDAKTFEDKLLTQLAAMKMMGLMKLEKPVSITANLIHTSHEFVTKLFITWLTLDPIKRKTIIKFSPKLKVQELESNNLKNYQTYIKLVTNSFIEFLEFDINAYLDGIVNTDKKALSDLEKSINKEIESFRNEYVYSKKVGKLTLESLATNPENTEINLHYKKCEAFLLNDGYRKPDNLARVYKIIQESNLPENEPLAAKRVKLTLEYLESEINRILELEGEFFDKRKFNRKNGTIVGDDFIATINDISIDSPKSTLKLKTPKLKLVLKTKEQIKNK